jgi:hypothetical protein
MKDKKRKGQEKAPHCRCEASGKKSKEFRSN